MALGQEQVNSLTPKSQSVETRVNTVSLADTTPKDMMIMPKGSQLLFMTVTGPTADAAATLDVGVKGVSADNLEAAFALDGAVQSVILGLDTDSGVLANDIMITANLGGATPTNGPWTIGIHYLRSVFNSA